MRILIIILFLFIPNMSFATECNSSSFEPFFKLFSNDKKFAINSSIYPLRSLSWEYGLDEQGKDASEATLKYLSKVHDQKTPSLSIIMKQHGLISRVKEVTNSKATVVIFKDGTDWLFEYHFKCNDNAWHFYEIEDFSL